jgi:hypothetical protein
MGKFTIAMKFTKRPSASPRGFGLGGKVVLTRRRAWMLGPCQPAQRGIPISSEEGREIIPKGPLSFLGKEMTLQKRDWNKGDKIERTKWGKKDLGEWRVEVLKKEVNSL